MFIWGETYIHTLVTAPGKTAKTISHERRRYRDGPRGHPAVHRPHTALATFLSPHRMHTSEPGMRVPQDYRQRAPTRANQKAMPPAHREIGVASRKLANRVRIITAQPMPRNQARKGGSQHHTADENAHVPTAGGTFQPELHVMHIIDRAARQASHQANTSRRISRKRSKEHPSAAKSAACPHETASRNGKSRSTSTA